MSCFRRTMGVDEMQSSDPWWFHTGHLQSMNEPVVAELLSSFLFEHERAATRDTEALCTLWRGTPSASRWLPLLPRTLRHLIWTLLQSARHGNRQSSTCANGFSAYKHGTAPSSVSVGVHPRDPPAHVQKQAQSRMSTRGHALGQSRCRPRTL